VRDRARAGTLVVLDREGHGVGPTRRIGMGRILLRGRLAVPEIPTPGRDRAVGIAALVAEAAAQPVASERERRRRWLVGHADGHRVRDRARAGTLVVLDREGHGVGPTRRIGMGRILLRGRLAVPEIPTPGRDRAVGIAALVAEA